MSLLNLAKRLQKAQPAVLAPVIHYPSSEPFIPAKYNRLMQEEPIPAPVPKSSKLKVLGPAKPRIALKDFSKQQGKKLSVFQRHLDELIQSPALYKLLEADKWYVTDMKLSDNEHHCLVHWTLQVPHTRFDPEWQRIDQLLRHSEKIVQKGFHNLVIKRSNTRKSFVPHVQFKRDTLLEEERELQGLFDKVQEQLQVKEENKD